MMLVKDLCIVWCSVLRSGETSKHCILLSSDAITYIKAVGTGFAGCLGEAAGQRGWFTSSRRG
jgi:hypothetical protein